MSELSPQVSPEEAQNYSNKLATLERYKAANPVETTESHLQLVKNETASPLPQRVRGGETAAIETPVVETTQSDTEIETEPATIDLGPPQRVDSLNAEALLERLRASQDFKDAAALNQGSENVATGAHVDTTVEVDSDSRVPGKHRAGTHVDGAEVTIDSEIQTGGKHLREEVSVEAQVALTPEKHRKFGSILRFLRKRSNNK